jgi:Xaa-Pro dipeptidase
MIATDEYNNRMDRLQQQVRQNGLSAFLVTAQDSIYYLTGVTYVPLERPFFIIIQAGRDPILLTPALDQEHLKSAPNVGAVHRYWEYPSLPGEGWPERLHELLSGISRLGVEPSLSQEIAVQLSDFDPVVMPLVETLRLVKSPAEIAMLRQAARFVYKGMEKIIQAAYYGVSEIEIFSQGRAIQTSIIKETQFDALNTSVLTAAWPNRLGMQPHGVPLVDDRLEQGSHIALSQMRVNGYGAECERTFFVSPPTNEMKNLFSTMQEARRVAFKLIKSGVSCAQIDTATREFLKQEGFASNLLHRTGHGFGLGTHEGPWVAEGSQDVLRENLLISNEPGIYIPGLGAFRHSDTLLVTTDGYENLTPYPDDLNSLVLLGSRLLTRIKGAIIRRAVGVN